MPEIIGTLSIQPELRGVAEVALAELQAAMRASDESMTSISPGLSGPLLQRVMACLEQLRGPETPDGKPTA